MRGRFPGTANPDTHVPCLILCCKCLQVRIPGVADRPCCFLGIGPHQAQVGLKPDNEFGRINTTVLIMDHPGSLCGIIDNQLPEIGPGEFIEPREKRRVDFNFRALIVKPEYAVLIFKPDPHLVIPEGHKRMCPYLLNAAVFRTHGQQSFTCNIPEVAGCKPVFKRKAARPGIPFH